MYQHYLINTTVYTKKKNYNSRNIITWLTQPILTEFTCSGLTFALSRAALLAIAPRLVAVTSFSFPPNVPNGVLLAPTTNTPIIILRKVEKN